MYECLRTAGFWFNLKRVVSKKIITETSSVLAVYFLNTKEIGLEINTRKTKCMLMSRHQGAEKIHKMIIANRSFGNLAHFKYLGTTVTNQNFVHEEINRRSISGKASYHSFQNKLSSRML
jgi:hypothetical protein